MVDPLIYTECSFLFNDLRRATAFGKRGVSMEAQTMTQKRKSPAATGLNRSYIQRVDHIAEQRHGGVQ
jgi:hypothetical protein